MTVENELSITVARRLSRLLASKKLNESEVMAASLCLRRLNQPLRAVVFGTYPIHAISLLNLMIGKPLLPPRQRTARVKISHSANKTFADAQLGDGTVRRLTEERFGEMFADHPVKVKVSADLPVLNKVEFFLASDAEPEKLCLNDGKTLLFADFVIWAGGEMTEPLVSTWKQMPDQIRSHSHLVLPQSIDLDGWAPIRDEFVSALQVDPEQAQAAKARSGGADRETFEASGGMAFVSEVKREIGTLRQSALDLAQLILIRHGADSDDFGSEEKPQPQRAAPSVADGISTPAPVNDAEETAVKPSAKAPDKPKSNIVKLERSEAEESVEPEERRATPWSLGL